MWETLIIILTLAGIYVGYKMFGRLCSYTPWGCYYRGDNPIYVIVITNNRTQNDIKSLFREKSECPVSIVVVDDEEVQEEYFNKTVDLVRAMVNNNVQKSLHTIILLETSVEYCDRFKTHFRDVQICEDVDALISGVLEYDW